ncbi:glycosyltransferase [Sphingomonas gei]|uniref:Glycosyltransferase n=1 Tax=Sphingomonas gei TaxID=1395960 RepID=A0A4S1WZR4_9SPHN|nr:glycosyltransferase [Sphingomonas gei]TGX49078.1 glycosyltransferase [Sphingomonas gei]
MGSLVVSSGQSKGLVSSGTSIVPTNGSRPSCLIFLATRWGAQLGGINSFNADLARAAARIASATTVVCIVEKATATQVAEALQENVHLSSADLSDANAVHAAVDAISSPVAKDSQHWIGHDVHSGNIAIVCAERFGGTSSVIHHMDFHAYAGIRHGSLIADEKSRGQRDVLVGARHRFAVGPTLGDSAHRLVGEPAHILIPGLPEIRPSSRVSGAYQILVAGRMSRTDDAVKQARLALEAVARATRKEDLASIDWRLEIIGADEGPNYLPESDGVAEHWRQLTDAYLPHFFLPFDTERTSLFGRIKSADLLLMPSLREGFGLIGWEAIGAGVPVVLSERSGAYEYLKSRGRHNSVQHLLVKGGSVADGTPDEADIEALSELIVRACRDRQALKEQALVLRRDLLRDGHHWDDCAAEMLAVLRVPVGLRAHLRQVTERQPVIALGEFAVPTAEPVGRDAELAHLSAVWQPAEAGPSQPATTRIAIVTGAGGLGKSTLVGHWARQLLREDTKPDYLLAWSFRSQGTSGGTQSMALVDWILGSFGMLPNRYASFDERLELAVELLVSARGVLILDGLETVQFGPGEPNAGRISDEGVATLLERLIELSQGGIVVGSRFAPIDLINRPATRIDLQTLSPEAGADLLRERGLAGDRGELLSYAERLRGHPLTLNLFAGFVRERARGELRAIDRFLDAVGDDPDVGRVLRAYVEQWFRNDRAPDETAFQILRAVSLFDRPAAPFAIAALREANMSGLAGADVSDAEVEAGVGRLRKAGLLLENDGRALDLHPIVRGWVETNFESEDLEAYRQAHEVLYRALREAGIAQRDVDGSLDLLYQCLRHGVRAGLPKLVADKTLGPEIRRHNENRSVALLGLVSEELDAFGHFFRRRYHELGLGRPGYELEPFDEAWVLNSTSTLLFGLGRVAEAADVQVDVVTRTGNLVKRQNLDFVVEPFWGPPETDDLRGQLSTALKNLAESRALLGDERLGGELASRALDAALDASAMTKEAEARALLTWIPLMSGFAREAAPEALKAIELVLSAPVERVGTEAINLLTVPLLPLAVGDNDLLGRLIVAARDARGETPLRTYVLSRMNLLIAALSGDQRLVEAAWPLCIVPRLPVAPPQSEYLVIRKLEDLDRILRKSGHLLARIPFLFQRAVIYHLGARHWAKRGYRERAEADVVAAQALARRYGVAALVRFDPLNEGRDLGEVLSRWGDAVWRH